MALLSRKKNNAAPARGGSASSRKPVQKPPRGARLKQIRTAFTVTRRQDPKIVPLCLAAFFGPLVLFLAIGLVIDHPFVMAFLGLMVGLLATAFVFGRRVQRTAYAGVEGQPGAAAAVLNTMRGNWRVTPAVGFNRDQELVHRVVGRPGVILVAEGQHRGTRNLIAAQKKTLSRVIGDVPVYDVLVGDSEGMVPLRGLERHFAKLPRNIKPKLVNELDAKLKALPNSNLPIPKGPMPKGGKIPRGKVR